MEYKWRQELNPRAWIAELVATFALVFFGTLSITVTAVLQGAPPTTSPASLFLVSMTHGLAIGLMIYAIGHISGGHINPAVTVAMLIARRIGVLDGVAYIIAQLVGGILGAAAHAALLPMGRQVSFGLNQPGPGIGEGGALVAEVILTFFLVFVIFGVAVHPRAAPGWAGFAIGMTIALDHFVGVPISGASMNPARTFGPALVSLNFAAHWVYWVGPLLGGILAALVYWYGLMGREERSS